MTNALTTLLSSNWKSVPTEVVHLILLFTGKFVFDKNGKLKSIVNLHDFENIKQHLGIFHLFFEHHLLRINEMEQFIMYLHEKIYNRDVMDKEERKHEEILAYMGVDYKKHPLLFLKETPIEEVMVPLQPNIFCGKCENKLTSVELTQPKKTKKTLTTTILDYNDEVNGIIFYHYNVVYLKYGQCNHCFELINKKDKKVEEKELLVIRDKKYSEPRKMPYLKNYNKMRTNNKKSFRFHF